MYKAAYGDLKVPSRFVVPAMPPWPGMYSLFVFVVLVCVLICCGFGLFVCLFVVGSIVGLTEERLRSID